MRSIVHKLANDTGAEIAEAALVLPIVFMFLLGIVWFGRAFNIYSTITQAAQQGAITAARPSSASTVFPSTAAVANQVVSVLQASSLDLSQMRTYQPPSMQGCKSPEPTCQTSQHVTVCRQVLLNQTSAENAEENPQAPLCGTLVSFQYRFTPYLSFTSLPLKLMTAQAQSRMEN